MNNGAMASAPLPSGEHDCLMTEVQIRSSPPVLSKKSKQPADWLQVRLCENKFTLGLCLALVLTIAIVIALLCLYILHGRVRAERKTSTDRSIVHVITLCARSRATMLNT